MTLTTVGKNGRVYQRRFDHDDANRRYAAGEPITALAREYGVSWLAVQRVVVPGVNTRMLAASRAAYTAVCEECRRPCLSVKHPAKAAHCPDGRNLCAICRGISQRTRFELTPGGVPVAALCVTCKRMLNLDEFPGGVKYRDVRPNGVHTQCRACQTETRRERRHKTRVPCSHGCGAMVDRNPAKQPECRPCANRRSTAQLKAEGRLFRAKVAA